MNKIDYYSNDIKTISYERTSDFVAFVTRHQQLYNQNIHYVLHNNLIGYFWEKKGNIGQRLKYVSSCLILCLL